MPSFTWCNGRLGCIEFFNVRIEFLWMRHGSSSSRLDMCFMTSRCTRTTFPFVYLGRRSHILLASNILFLGLNLYGSRNPNARIIFSLSGRIRHRYSWNSSQIFGPSLPCFRWPLKVGIVYFSNLPNQICQAKGLHTCDFLSKEPNDSWHRHWVCLEILYHK